MAFVSITSLRRPLLAGKHPVRGRQRLDWNSDAVAVTGVTTGSIASARKVLARQPIYGTLTVAGGAASETIDFALPSGLFSTRPDAGWIRSSDWDRMDIRYDIDESTSTNAKLRLTMTHGSNLPTLAAMEITGEFTEYD